MANRLPDPLRIRLTGRGGQGIMLAGAVLAEAAMLEGRQVVETQEYGPEARLGATKAEIVIASQPIGFPAVEHPDVLLCLSRDSLKRYGQDIAEGGRRLVEASVADSGPAPPGVVYLPLRDTARRLGNELVTNMLALGALAAWIEVVSRDSLEAALAHRVKPEWADLNRRALEEGWELGRRVAGASVATG